MAREGLQFTQDRLKAGSRELPETSKSSSVSVNAAGFCACERSAIFVDLRCTSGAGANRNRQGGTGNQGRGRGDKKANGISAANPHPVVKGERRPVGGRAIHHTHPPPQTVCRGAVYPSRRKKTGTVRRKPAIPPTRRPPSRQAPPQTGACETNNCAKTGKCRKKGEFCCKVALCVRRES